MVSIGSSEARGQTMVISKDNLYTGLQASVLHLSSDWTPIQSHTVLFYIGQNPVELV